MSEINNSSDDQSAKSLSVELYDFCESELLSEEGLREIIERHGLTADNHAILAPTHDSDFSFYFACRNERVTEGIIRCLLEYFPDAANFTNVEDEGSSERGWTPLHAACGNENVTEGIIQLLVDAHPDFVRKENYRGHMPLHTLCFNSKLDEATAIQILKLLVAAYPEAVRHAPNNGGHLPIHFASWERSPEFCRVLIEAYPGSERITTRTGNLPLHSACFRGTLATVEYLHKLYPDAIAVDANVATGKEYPIHAVIRGVNHRDNPADAVEIVQFLLDCDPNQKLVQFGGKSLLHYAFEMRYNSSNIDAGLQVIGVLFDAHPASISSVSNEGQMPLHILCRNSNVHEAAAMRMLMFLIRKHSEAVRHTDNQGRLPIHYASTGKSPEFCRLLIEAYPGSERMTNAGGGLPLHQACATNSLSMVQYLFRLHPEAINHATREGHYPIHAAIMATKHRRRGNPDAAGEILQFLLDCDPDVKLKKLQGKSLLRYACAMEYNNLSIEEGIRMIKILFDTHPEAIKSRRIESNMQRYHQRVQAFINGELVYARQAKDHRLMMTPDDNGQLSLHKALQNNVRLGSIKLLVKGNLSALRTVDDNLAMPLHIACQHHDSARVVQYLLSIDDVALNAVDRHWNTGLHYACRGAKDDTIALLLEKYDAASVSRRNVDGKLPIDLLWESNAVEDRESVEYTGSVFQLLKAYPEMIQSAI